MATKPTPPKAARVTNADGSFNVPKRRAVGDGAAFFDKSVNRHKVRFTGPDGRTYTTSGTTAKQAKERKDAKLAALAEATMFGLGDDPAFEDLAKEWLKKEAPREARPNTLRSYEQDVARLCELKHLRRAPISSIDSKAAQRVVDDIRAKKGHGTTVNARARLNQILGYAAREGKIPGVPKTTPPKRTEEERTPKEVLNAAQIKKLIAVCDGSHPLDAGVVILFTAGWRASEVLGLCWDDLDFEAGTAHVTRGCTYTPATGIRLDLNKTRETTGVVTLHPKVIELLKLRKQEQEADQLKAQGAWIHHTYEGVEVRPVFTGETGALLREQRLGDHLSRRRVKAGLGKSKATHTGRRSVITALDTAGVELDKIAGYVGHGRTETTLRYLQNHKERATEVAHIAADLF